MLTFEPFKADHLLYLTDPIAKGLHASGAAFHLSDNPSFTGRTPEGKIVGCAGLHPFLWKSRWNAWAFFEPETRPYMRQIIRFACVVLDNCGADRVEAHVRAGFKQGFKFPSMLGFVLETPEPMRRWSEHGEDVYQFARVR